MGLDVDSFDPTTYPSADFSDNIVNEMNFKSTTTVVHESNTNSRMDVKLSLDSNSNPNPNLNPNRSDFDSIFNDAEFNNTNNDNFCSNALNYCIKIFLRESLSLDSGLYKTPIVDGFEIKHVNSLRILQTNIRGFSSKKEILEKLLDDMSVDVALVNKSHVQSNKVSKINLLKVFSRNRKVIMKGGICIFIRESLAQNVTQCFSGEDEVSSCGDEQCVPTVAVGYVLWHSIQHLWCGST